MIKDSKDIMIALDKVRLEQDIELSTVCANADVSRTTYWRYLSGKGKVPYDVVVRVAEALGLRIIIDIPLDGIESLVSDIRSQKKGRDHR